MNPFDPLDPAVRHDLLLVLSVHHSNPNAEVDSGAPRVNPFTGHGLISGVSVKRKVRDYIQFAKGDEPGYALLVRHGDVMATTAYRAMQDAGAEVSDTLILTHADVEALTPHTGLWGRALTLSGTALHYHQTLKAKQIGTLVTALAEAGISAALLGRLRELLSVKKGGGPGREDRYAAALPVMRQTFADVRLFGMSAPESAGKLRGPVQVGDGESLAPVNLISSALTRVARGTSDEHKDGAASIGRRTVVDHAVYRIPVFYNATLRVSSGVTQADLSLLVEGLYHGQALARSAARPDVRAEAVVIFSHSSPLGNAPSSGLFRRVQIDHDGGEEVNVQVNQVDLPAGISVQIVR